MAKKKRQRPGWRKRLIRLMQWAVFLFFVSSISLTIIYRFVFINMTPLMVINLFNQIRTHQDIGLEKNWRNIETISPHMILAVIAAEDQNFLSHNGFDFRAIKTAYHDNRKGMRIRGASTISQQTAKNVFLWPQRSWIRKGLEAYFTVLIEILWSKKRILEIYLNIAEFGNETYGVEASAQHYFHKSADRLTREEAALLSAMLPSPRKYNPEKPTPYLIKRQQWILAQMNNLAGAVSFD